jgi:hypothetical protein
MNVVEIIFHSSVVRKLENSNMKTVLMSYESRRMKTVLGEIVHMSYEHGSWELFHTPLSDTVVLI